MNAEEAHAVYGWEDVTCATIASAVPICSLERSLFA